MKNSQFVFLVKHSAIHEQTVHVVWTLYNRAVLHLHQFD